MAIIKIDDETVLKIEQLQYEIESRKDVIAQALSGTINMRNDMFKKYHTEYQEYYKKYNKAKSEMVAKYMKGTEYEGKAWNLDFESQELTIFE